MLINMGSQPMFRILFICMGNICRSPTAEGVMRRRLEEAGLAKRVQVDSAGTVGAHAGEAPDVRAQRTAKARGVDLSRLRARQVEPRDFDKYDLILSMDRRNLEILREQCQAWHLPKLKLLMSYGSSEGEEVPDPYYGGPQGFEVVFDLVDDAVTGLIADLRRQGLGESPKP